MIAQGAVITKNRFNIILSVALIWAGFLSVRLFYFSIIKREHSFTQMQSESQEKGRIRAMRGRILSADGDLLAYTQRITALHIRSNISSNQLNSLVEILEKEMGISRRKVLVKLANAGQEESVVIADNLNADFITRFSKYFTRNSAVFLKMNFKRVYNSKSRKIGAVESIDGQLIGISGFEKKYDQLLKGQDLIYEVMVDRQNRVIEKTYTEVSKMTPGRDIHLTEEEWP